MEFFCIQFIHLFFICLMFAMKPSSSVFYSRNAQLCGNGKLARLSVPSPHFSHQRPPPPGGKPTFLPSPADCYDEKEKLLAEKVQELEQLHVDYFKDRMDTYKKDLKDEARPCVCVRVCSWEGLAYEKANWVCKHVQIFKLLVQKHVALD